MNLRSRARALAPVSVLFGAFVAAMAQSAPQPAIPALLGLFDRYQVVILAEDHWLRANGEFYISLVRSPEFTIAVGTPVARCPPHRSGRALISASGSSLG